MTYFNINKEEDNMKYPLSVTYYGVEITGPNMGIEG
jgi:hypothetical protein